MRGKKGTVVMVNGIFDLLHEGHLGMLRFAKTQGSWLVVAINSDRVTKLLKGEERPVQNEHMRKAALEKIEWVDEVIIFDELRPTGTISIVRPHIIVKGSEYTEARVREVDDVPLHIRILFYPLVLGADGKKVSTTDIIERMKKEAGA